MSRSFWNVAFSSEFKFRKAANLVNDLYKTASNFQSAVNETRRMPRRVARLVMEVLVTPSLPCDASCSKTSRVSL